MENIFVFISYLLYSIVGFWLVIAIIDSKISWSKLIPIGIMSGIADFLVKEILVPKFNLPDGLHFITGVLVITALVYFLLKLKVGISFAVSLLTYIISALSEFPILILLMMIFGKENLVAWSSSKITTVLLGFLSMTPMTLALIYIKLKKVKFLEKLININLYRM